MDILLQVLSRTAALLFILMSLNSVAQEVQQELYFDMDTEGGWVPFLTAAEPGNPGIMTEITEAIQRHIDVRFIPVKLPQKRAEIALKEGLMDFDFICLEWLENGVVGPDYIISEPFFELTENFITLKKNSQLFLTRASLNQKHVGTISGYFYFDDHTFKRTDFLDENHLMLGLKHERFEVIIMEQEAAKHWAKINDMDINFAVLHSKGNFLMRLKKKHQGLLPLINQAIKQMKTSGELQDILDKHNTQIKIF
jgi:polar amino acid transport system substrate-binding protein